MKLFKKLIVFSIIAGFACFSACSSNDGDKPSTEGKNGSFSLSIAEDMSKMFIPALDMATDHYNIHIVGPRPAGPDNERTIEVANTPDKMTPPIVPNFEELYYGRWTVTVQAHNADPAGGTIIGQGVNTVVVNPWSLGAAIPQVTVTVIPIPGTGSLHVDVLWNGDVTEDPYLLATLTPLSGSGAALNVVNGPASGTIDNVAPLENGYYTLTVELRERGVSNEELLVQGAAEVIRIVTGQPTVGVIDFASLINPHFGDMIVNIDPQMREPIILDVTGAELLIAQNDTMDLTVSVDNETVIDPERTVPAVVGGVVYFWYENGEFQGTGNSITLTADPLQEYLMIDQYYRVDVVAYSADGLRGGSSSFTYTVTELLTPNRSIIAFNVPGATGSGATIIDSDDTGTILVELPYGVSPVGLSPTIVTDGAKTVVPASGVPIVANYQTYTVTAYDPGVNPRVYTLVVSNALNPAKDITGFAIPGAVSTVINTDTILIQVPVGTDRSSLTPTITITGASVSPASGVAVDFTNPVVYTVTAEDSTTKNYTVTVLIYDPTIPTLRPAQYISTLTAAEGTVVFEGLDPANAANGTIRRYTLRADGTLDLYWNANNMGYITSNGTWAYDSNDYLTIEHFQTGGMQLHMLEIYHDTGIVTDNGNILTFQTRRKGDGNPNTILGEYPYWQYVRVQVPPISMDMQVTVTGLEVVSNGDPIPWVYDATSVVIGGATPAPIHEEGTLVIPTDVWLYQIGSKYYIKHDSTYDMTRQ